MVQTPAVQSAAPHPPQTPQSLLCHCHRHPCAESEHPAPPGVQPEEVRTCGQAARSQSGRASGQSERRAASCAADKGQRTAPCTAHWGEGVAKGIEHGRQLFAVNGATACQCERWACQWQVRRASVAGPQPRGARIRR